MSSEEVKEIKKLLNEKFKNKEIYINITGTIETLIVIKNFKFFISENTIIFSDGKKTEFKINDCYYIDEVSIEKTSLEFKMSGEYSIRIDY